MNDRVPMTGEGRKRLEVELRNLKSVERPAVILAIEEARGHGDLSENAEYSAARERQSFIEGRIKTIEDRLVRAEVIDPKSLSGSKVLFGATVELIDDNGQPVTYKIVGEDEADIKKNKVSILSPLAKALLGRESGDEVQVRAPKGTVRYEISEVRFE